MHCVRPALNGNTRPTITAGGLGFDLSLRQEIGVVRNFCESRTLAHKCFRAPVRVSAGKAWAEIAGRRPAEVLIQILQRHFEKKLVTAGMRRRADFSFEVGCF